jgi:RND family efflux transporter MFP subunit
MKYIKMIILSFILLIYGCKEEVKVIDDKPIPITLAKVKKTSLSVPITTSGKVSAGMETILSFKTGGIVKRLFVNEGQEVHKGDILAQLDLSEIKAKVNQANEGLKKAERDFMRITSLYKDSVVTLEQYQNVETALNVAKANSEIANFNLNYSKIVAPTKGKIFRKFVEENQLVSGGTPIIQFGSSTNNWIIKCGISDLHISKVKLGDEANITLDALPSKNIQGKISEIASSANPVNGTFEVEISINEKVKIISGMIADVEIFSSQKENGYLVPIQSFVEAEGNSATLFILSEDKNYVKSVKVEIGEIIDSMILVNSPELELVEVVDNGVEYITDGSKVIIVGKEK